MIERYERIEEQLGRLMSYAQLLHAAKADDPQIGRFYQTIHERVTKVGTRLLFLTLELNRIEDQALAEKLEQSALLARYRPWIRDVRTFRPHQLDDEIERVLHEKSVTGRSAWVRLFDETMAEPALPARRQGADQQRGLRPALGPGPRQAAGRRDLDRLRCSRPGSGCSR